MAAVPVANKTSAEKKKVIILLGAGERLLYDCTLPRAYRGDASGVVGLTTALNIQRQGNYRVTVVSEIIPSDPSSIKYTSRWAVGYIRLLINHDGTHSLSRGQTMYIILLTTPNSMVNSLSLVKHFF